MAGPLKPLLARALYAALFSLAVPALLVCWAAAANGNVPLPSHRNPLLGSVLVFCGAGLMLAGVSALWFRGGGLPMNAFPPPRYVSNGIYGWLPHPIYVGFTLICVGFSALVGSAGGLWLVSPTVALCCAALVLGYEAPDLRRRFGRTSIACRLLPADGDARPTPLDHLRYATFVLMPWLALYELVIALGVPGDGFEPSFPFERTLPIWPLTELFYASTYIAVPLASALAPSRTVLRGFFVRAWLAMILAFPLYVTVPFLAPRRSFTPSGPLGYLLEWERGTYPPVAAFPSFHVIWSFLVAHLFGRRFPELRWIGWAWAVALAASCVTTGMHTIVDVVAAALLALGLIRIEQTWSAIRSLTERIANSWREWRFGPVRVINHGAYAGLAAFAAVAIVHAAVGDPLTTCTTALSALVGAALWAQFIEGSSRLARPFGFYGGFFGVAASAAIGSLFGWDAWLLVAAWCLASPPMQAIGRLRCLVQGCCHGSPTAEVVGIRYTHARSRVCRLAHLDGIPVHATPLYSIFWNGFVALALVRMWTAGAPLHMIAGIFAILTGIGRFVEEAYRGEPQTPVLAGLRLYQWVAIGTVVAGAVITAVATSTPAPALQFSPEGLAQAAIFALIAAFALGVDFPDSQRRFARLA
jgi:protein-S-isoprenylcysteine O-methyltransferase Ste14